VVRHGAGRAGPRFASIAAAVLVSAAPSLASAQEALDYPIPSEAAEALSPIREGFTVPLYPRDDLRGPAPTFDARESRLEAARQTRWPNLPIFIRDSSLSLDSRTYWFDEDDFGYDHPKAFTTGGSLSFESGYLANFFQLRSVLYTTQPLYANADAGQSLNLTKEGDEITTLGQLNGRVRFAGQQVTVGRQLVRTPYINPYDSRMIPITFEGIVWVPDDQGPDQTFDYIASYLMQYKPRNQANFIPFSEGLSVSQDYGVLITGASYHKNGFNIGATNYWIEDTLNTAYGEIDYLLPFGEGNGGRGPQVRLGANILDQRTVGSSTIAGAPYDTYQASARLVASYCGLVLEGAVSATGDEASIQKPFGFSPSYTAMLVTNFRQAGVDAYLLSLSYDFAQLGLDGVKFKAAFGKGWGIEDPVTNGDFSNQQELDLRFVYEPPRGALQGLRVEVEYIDWTVFDDALPSDNLTQFRTIVNYTVPLL
jgi:hypothetical protein